MESFGRRLPKSAVSLVALLFPAAALAQVLWIAARVHGGLVLPYVQRFATPWIAVTGFHADFSFLLDQLTLVMLLVVTGVGFLIHLYSISYMAEEEGYWRFFSYMNLFLFFMLTLVLAANFLLMFVGWEGVGLVSYLLIGFYYNKDSAANAGKKAFIVNRIGDFGFLIAMFLLIVHFGTLSFSGVFGAISAHPQMQGGVLTGIALLLLLGATGKSAQIPLYVWLPDAMEGPTPVSALIHAATMVTAGVYMIARAHVLFNRSPAALAVVAIIGVATAFFAATIGMVQNDIKRVLAYSTISQLGYMFLACGVAAYSMGIFHVVTHAFFKALLFLAAGSAIHALGGTQDMREMGGLRRENADHVLDHDGRGVCHQRILPFCRILQQGRHSGRDVSDPARRQGAVGRRSRHCGADFVLYVPALVYDLLRRGAIFGGGGRPRRTWRPGEFVGHAAASGDPGHSVGDWRMDRLARSAWGQQLDCTFSRSCFRRRRPRHYAEYGYVWAGTHSVRRVSLCRGAGMVLCRSDVSAQAAACRPGRQWGAVALQIALEQILGR